MPANEKGVKHYTATPCTKSKYEGHWYQNEKQQQTYICWVFRTYLLNGSECKSFFGQMYGFMEQLTETTDVSSL